MKGKISSLLVALAYLVFAFAWGGGATALICGTFLIIPLGCIWFSEALGDYSGMGMANGEITETTPARYVIFSGWGLMMLPVLVGLVSWHMSSR